MESKINQMDNKITIPENNEIVYAYSENGDFITGKLYTQDDVSNKSEVEQEVKSYLGKENIQILRINKVLFGGVALTELEKTSKFDTIERNPLKTNSLEARSGVLKDTGE